VKKIYIRCDAGNVKDFGTGHVSRMIILAESLRKKIKRIEVIFLTRKDNNFKTGAQMILRAGLKIHKCEDRVLKPNSQNELKLFKELNADLLIIDRLFLSEKSSKKLKISNIKYIVFDTKKNRHIKNDQLFNFMNLNDKKVLNKKNLQYFIFNPKLKKNIKKNKDYLFICFGGVDKKKYSLSIIKNFVSFNIFKKIFIVCREKKLFLKMTRTVIKKKINKKFIILLNPKNFYGIMAKCKFSITAGGLTFIDALASGSNTIAIPQYAHQMQNIDYFHKAKLSLFKFNKKFTLNKEIINYCVNLFKNEKNFKGQRNASNKYFNLTNNNMLIKKIYKIINERSSAQD